MSAKDLAVNPERIRAAARSCPDADKVLRAIFPEAFESEAQSPYVAVSITRQELTLDMRRTGDLAEHGWYLNGERLRYAVVRDNQGFQVLVLKKEV